MLRLMDENGTFVAGKDRDDLVGLHMNEHDKMPSVT